MNAGTDQGNATSCAVWRKVSKVSSWSCSWVSACLSCVCRLRLSASHVDSVWLSLKASCAAANQGMQWQSNEVIQHYGRQQSGFVQLTWQPASSPLPSHGLGVNMVNASGVQGSGTSCAVCRCAGSCKSRLTLSARYHASV